MGFSNRSTGWAWSLGSKPTRAGRWIRACGSTTHSGRIPRWTTRLRRRCIRRDSSHDILPKMVEDYKLYSYNFVDENKKEALYWRDVGTLEAYYEANMDIVSVSPIFNLYDKDWLIRT